MPQSREDGGLGIRVVVRERNKLNSTQKVDNMPCLRNAVAARLMSSDQSGNHVKSGYRKPGTKQLEHSMIKSALNCVPR